MTVVPAYGRDYKSAKAVKADWAAGKDFLVADIFSQWDSKPVNKEQLVGQSVTVRYCRLTKVCVVQ